MKVLVLLCVNFFISEGMLLEREQNLLQCPLGQYVSFTSGRYFYGGCGADVTRALQINCCNRRSCLVEATNAWVGVDPCVGDTKNLEWNMVCEDMSGMCSNDPCGNGTCVNHCVHYTCICYPGYGGSNCEIDLDECASSPCVHGTCQDAINNFTCLCQAGYTGVLCEEDLDECASSPCVHGTCLDAINNLTCFCKPGYNGLLCEQDIDDCRKELCSHGTCQDQINGYSCHCDLLYSGENCQVNKISLAVIILTISFLLGLSAIIIWHLSMRHNKRQQQEVQFAYNNFHFEDASLGQAKKKFNQLELACIWNV